MDSPAHNRGLIPQAHGGALKPFLPGNLCNPGGAPKGKRVATWMAEFGEKPQSAWPRRKTKEYEKLPGNAVIALQRLRCAIAETGKTSNSEYVEPRSRPEADAPDTISVGNIERIAAAIAALEASGVVFKRAAPIEVENLNDK